MYVIEAIDFNRIYKYWECLWPNRKTPIEPSNPIQFMGGIDLSLKDVVPTFFGCYKNNKLVGVNSGIKTHTLLYRSRGIWTSESERRNGIGSLLLNAVEKQGITEGCEYIWSMPRYSSYKFYKRNGFVRCSKWLGDYEFGPNCFVLKRGDNERTNI